MAKIPEGSAYRAEWGKLDSATRRRIVRSVNKGEALEKRREAALAVATARRQQRFWKRAWLLGPLAALLTVGEGVVVYVANALLSTAIIGVMGLFWYRRAGRAAAANLDAADGRRKRSENRPGKQQPPKQPGKQQPEKQQASKPGRRRRRGHLPGRDD